MFALYWLGKALESTSIAARETRVQRFVHALWLTVTFFLLYQQLPYVNALNRRFLPESFWIAEAAALFTAIGIAFAIWARWHIGTNWSAEIAIRKDHQLIRTGPYRSVRHPIYTGLLLALLGTGLAVGEYRALVALGTFAVGWTIKARREEGFLFQQFGPAFEDHKRSTGFFLPRLS